MVVKEAFEKLKSTELRVAEINKAICDHCDFVIRCNAPGLTPSDEINASNLWVAKEIYDMSMNIVICEHHGLSFNCEAEFVKYLFEGYERVDFEDDLQLANINPNSLKLKYHKCVLLCIEKNILESIKDTVPFGNIGRDGKAERTINFQLKVVKAPLLLNVFHVTVEVSSDKDGEMAKIIRGHKAGYAREIAAKIRNTIIDDKLCQII